MPPEKISIDVNTQTAWLHNLKVGEHDHYCAAPTTGLVAATA